MSYMHNICLYINFVKDNMSISHRIKEIRRKLNLSQKDFADKIGVDQARVSRWEKEKSLPSSVYLTEISRLGVNINWLLTGEGLMMQELPFLQGKKSSFSAEQRIEIEKIVENYFKKNK